MSYNARRQIVSVILAVWGRGRVSAQSQGAGLSIHPVFHVLYKVVAGEKLRKIARREKKRKKAYRERGNFKAFKVAHLHL